MVTGSPSKRISPLSAVYVPATHLISVDLPAPLSPTSAITSPWRTSKSTSVSARTEPKSLEAARTSSVGVWDSVMGGFLPCGGGAAKRPPRSRVCLAVLLVDADADLALL